MSTIPASNIVRVLPNVLNAGGSALVMNGMLLTRDWRVPVGEVLSFANDGVSVSDFFGAAADETALADIYFNGYNNSTKRPENILFARSTLGAVGAWLLGGPINQLTIPELQGLSGSLSIVVDGYTFSAASIDLSAATSYSAAAALIESGLNASPPTAASVTAAIATGAGSVTASISGNVLTVTAVASGSLAPGATLSGTGVTAGTKITSQLTGTTGDVGTYAVDTPQGVASTTITAAFGTMTVSAVASGTLAVGQTLSGSGVTAGTKITGLGTGEGLTGTYYVDDDTVVASTTVTASGTDLSVTYDSVSGGFLVDSGITGAASTIAFATGTLAAGILLTSATGATLSQGADAQTPAGMMDDISQITQNWATFMTVFDPDEGEGTGQRLAFSAWVNTTDKRYAYVVWDNSIVPTESNNATTSLGNLIQTAEYDGSCVVYQPDGLDTTPAELAAFVCGTTASIDFDQTNGRITFAFRGQSGLIAGVTNATVATNLTANGYNFYGAYATANQQFLEFQTGMVSGQFHWMDSYVNQIWLNNAIQLALMELLVNVNSIPYNQAGNDLIRAAMMDPINAALNFGAIRAGVTLSSAQAAEINNAAGVKVSDVLQYQGWYFQIQDASPQTRQARQSPPINFWYMDGESVQKIELASILVQ